MVRLVDRCSVDDSSVVEYNNVANVYLLFLLHQIDGHLSQISSSSLV